MCTFQTTPNITVSQCEQRTVRMNYDRKARKVLEIAEKSHTTNVQSKIFCNKQTKCHSFHGMSSKWPLIFAPMRIQIIIWKTKCIKYETKLKKKPPKIKASFGKIKGKTIILKHYALHWTVYSHRLLKMWCGKIDDTFHISSIYRLIYDALFGSTLFQLTHSNWIKWVNNTTIKLNWYPRNQLDSNKNPIFASMPMFCVWYSF